MKKIPLKNNGLWLIILFVIVICFWGKANGKAFARKCTPQLTQIQPGITGSGLDPDTSKKNSPMYLVKKLKKPMNIDGKWDKPEWISVNAVELTHYMGDIPPFRPIVHAKMMYDDDNLYVIFQVNDRYVHSVIEEYNGPVSTEACVEFFFSPDTNFPDRYFNLEINAGGTPLMGYHDFPQKESQTLAADDLKKIEISHSLPRKVDPAIDTPVTWTIEYKLPIAVLEKYGFVTHPKPGLTWRANFYKTASLSSNPHYITWSFVDNPVPNFHLPRFFGQIRFEK